MIIQADTHVHLHDAYDVDEFFSLALSNMRRFVPDADGEQVIRILCMTDVEGTSTQDRLCQKVQKTANWQFSLDQTGRHVQAERASGEQIIVLPGRQIVSSENLEILALGYQRSEADKVTPLDTLIDQVIAAGALPVLPWGPGKWMGQRGALVEKLVETRSDIVLSDNGNRLCLGPIPELLVRARKKGLPVVAGSDPLPIHSTRRRVGMYGSLWHAEDSEILDVANILRQMQGNPEQVKTFGRLESPLNFVKNQFAMQVRKRMKKNAP